jgi:hypothetical protein
MGNVQRAPSKEHPAPSTALSHLGLVPALFSTAGSDNSLTNSPPSQPPHRENMDQKHTAELSLQTKGGYSSLNVTY